MEQVKLEEFNLKWHEIHGRLPPPPPPNLYTDTIIHKAAYSSYKTISPVVKQFHACNKSDHLQLRPEPPLYSNFCVALTMWHHQIFLVCCSVKLVSKSFLILGYMWKDHFVAENIQVNIQLINFNIFLLWYVLQMTKSCSDRLYDIMNSVLKAANCDSTTY